jgi:hypothetical protein
MQNDNQRGSGPQKGGGLPFLRHISQRINLFPAIFCFLGLFLYAAGTGQRFTDGNQLFLLRFSLLTGLLLALCSLCGAIGQIWSLVRLPRFGGFLSLLFMLLGTAAGAGAAIFASLVITAAGGNMP